MHTTHTHNHARTHQTHPHWWAIINGVCTCARTHKYMHTQCGINIKLWEQNHLNVHTMLHSIIQIEANETVLTFNIQNCHRVAKSINKYHKQTLIKRVREILFLILNILLCSCICLILHSWLPCQRHIQCLSGSLPDHLFSFIRTLNVLYINLVKMIESKSESWSKIRLCKFVATYCMRQAALYYVTFVFINRKKDAWSHVNTCVHGI